MQLTVYSRTSCHLCDEMVGGLRERGLEPEIIDVDRDPELASRYGLRVPVLVIDEEEICHFHLDAARLDRVLGGH